MTREQIEALAERRIKDGGDDLMFILGRPGFMFIREARLYRQAGFDIPTKAEEEQAFFIHRLLCFWLSNPEDWREAFQADVQNQIAKARAIAHTKGTEDATD